jgi:YVTN family beta-propeller protein
VTVLVACTSAGTPPLNPVPFGGRGVDEIELSHPVATVEIGKRFVWVLESAVNQRWFLEKVDTDSLEVLGRLLQAGSPLVSDMAIGRGSAWLLMPTLTGPSWDKEPGIVRRVDLDTERVTAEVRVGHHPGGIAWCRGSVWVSNTVNRSVMRIDPATNRVVATIEVGDGPNELVCGFGSVWVSNEFNRPVLMRIDVARNRVVARFPDLIRPVVCEEVLWTAGPGGPEDAVAPIDPKTNEIEIRSRRSTSAPATSPPAREPFGPSLPKAWGEKFLVQSIRSTPKRWVLLGSAMVTLMVPPVASANCGKGNNPRNSNTPSRSASSLRWWLRMNRSCPGWSLICWTDL